MYIYNTQWFEHNNQRATQLPIKKVFLHGFVNTVLKNCILLTQYFGFFQYLTKSLLMKKLCKLFFQNLSLLADHQHQITKKCKHEIENKNSIDYLNKV